MRAPVLLFGLAACVAKVGTGDSTSEHSGSGTSDTDFTPGTGDTGPYDPGPPNAQTSGSAETCLLLYGGNDRVRGPDDGDFVTDLPFEDRARTIQAWIRTDKLQEQTAFSYGRPSPGQGLQLATDNGFPILLTGWTSSQMVTGNIFVADDHWHHVVGSWDGTTAFVMVDGVLAGTGALPGSTLEGDVVAGNTPTGDLSKSWIGWVDDAKIIDGTRTIEEVVDDPEALTIDGAKLMLWWDFEVPEGSEGPGVEVPDLSANGHEGLSAGVDTPQFPRCR